MTLLSCVLLVSPIYINAQQEKERWQRVYTGEDFFIESNPSRMTFEPGQILRVKIQTVYSKPQSLRDKSGAKHKRVLETIDFKLSEKGYRIDEIEWIDSSGQTVLSHKAESSDDWKMLKPGGMMERLFHAVTALPPFGSWKVVDYRFGEAGSDSPVNARELTALIGKRVRIAPNSAEVGLQRCSIPSYRSRQSPREEFSLELGISTSAIGLKTDPVDQIVVKCDGLGWTPPRSLLVKLPDGGMLMLWEGVFLVLKRERN